MSSRGAFLGAGTAAAAAATLESAPAAAAVGDASLLALYKKPADPGGTAVVADLKNFAQAGVDILTFENIPA